MKPGLNNLSLWFGMIMVPLLLAGAFVFAFTDYMSDRMYGNKRTFFVVMLLAYAIYRSIRIYQTIKQNREEE